MGDHDVRKEILEYEELESFQLPDEGCDIKVTLERQGFIMVSYT